MENIFVCKGCVNGFYSEESVNYCYAVGETETFINYEAAKSKCASLVDGGVLAEFRDMDEFSSAEQAITDSAQTGPL